MISQNSTRSTYFIPDVLFTIFEHTTCRLLDSDLPRTYRNVSLAALQLVSDALKYGVVYPLLGYDLLALKDQHPRSPLNRESYLLTIC